MIKKLLFLILIFFALPCNSANRAPLPEVIVVFSLDDNYATFLPVTIASIKEHSNADRLYKIFVLGDNISTQHQEALYREQTKNIRLQLIDIQNLARQKNISALKTLGHINTATYYRFFIPEILQDYKKAVYLEADQILLDDVAKLFDVNLGEKSLGVIPQPSHKGNQSAKWQKYCQNQLKIKNPQDYFNAGVLVMNLEKLRNNNFEEKALAIAQNNNFTYLDQDILNFMFADDCVHISAAWNAEIFILKENPHLIAPKLVHFTGGYKPWQQNVTYADTVAYARLFWQYAAKTANYEEIINYENKH